mgnify:CR=1 FL=1
MTNYNRTVWNRLVWLGVFAVAMGLLEAICVIYLRRLFPVSEWAGVLSAPPLERFHIEIIREASTLVMLVAVAWLAGVNLRSRIACFFYAFGFWDIFYYVGLKWLANWPGSWLEWDCLFLIPKPWYGPVLAPVLISVYFIVACIALHFRLNVRWRSGMIVAQIVGFCIWFWSFIKDGNQIQVYGFHSVKYSWTLFALGIIIAIVGLWLTVRGNSERE